MPVNANFPPLTVENYKLLPETGPRYQLIQGDLYMAPAPNRFHQEISRNLQFELHSYLMRNRIGKLLNAPFDVYLDEINVFQPDIIVVLKERLGTLSGRRPRPCDRDSFAKDSQPGSGQQKAGVCSRRSQRTVDYRS